MPPPVVRFVAITIQVPENLAADVREHFDRQRTGSVTLHTDKGVVVATATTAHGRVRAASS